MRANLSKAQAVKLLSAHFSEYTITSQNTVFANLNKNRPVWWMTPDNNKFFQDLFIVLNDNSIKLYIFFIPANRINSPTTIFRQHNDNKVSIEISATDPDFIDVHKKNIVFKKFLLHQIIVSKCFTSPGVPHNSK